jgi:Signal transduction histidine kinase
MRFNLKLSQKGFVLVAVPLIFEIIFVLALAAMLEQAETERHLEEHSKAIVSTSENVSKYLFDAASSIVAWNVSHAPPLLKRFSESIWGIKSGVKNLVELTDEDKEQKKSTGKIVKLSDQVCNYLIDYGKRAERGEGEIDFSKFRQEIDVLHKPFLEELHKLADSQKARANEAPHAERVRKQRLNQFLIAGLTLNVLIAFLLSMFFKGITRRLRLLMSNAKLLARKQPLHNPLRGGDEIAELDGVFHEMADALVAAEERKQEFVSTICHDLRSPLANVQVSLALAAKGKYGELNNQGVERFQKAEQSIERLITLLNELLDAEKMEAGLLELDPAPMNLASAVAHSVDSVKTLAEEKRVSIKYGDIKDIEIIGDEARLVRVIVNLLSNAVKFTPEGSTVTVSIIQNVTNQGATTVDVRVSDQGDGIPDDAKEKIFDRFYRLGNSEKVSGIGLGLTICKNIVSAHRGQIGVDSVVGEGSTFWIRLPVD